MYLEFVKLDLGKTFRKIKNLFAKVCKEAQALEGQTLKQMQLLKNKKQNKKNAVIKGEKRHCQYY